LEVGMMYDVHLEQVNSQPLAVVRRRARPRELATVVPQACGTVWRVLQALQVRGAGRHVAVYWDCAINLEVGAEVETPFPGHSEVVGSSTPAGTAVTATHLGPYDRLHEAHTAIHTWCAANGHTLAGPSWEVYGHWEDDPAKLRTDVFYLLKATGERAG
jgi:effector-binding domain-containing protein